MMLCLVWGFERRHDGTLDRDSKSAGGCSKIKCIYSQSNHSVNKDNNLSSIDLH